MKDKKINKNKNTEDCFRLKENTEMWQSMECVNLDWIQLQDKRAAREDVSKLLGKYEYNLFMR